MTPARFHVTYDLVTPRSAEAGDIADSGYVTPGQWRTSTYTAPVREFGAIHDETALTLRQAIDLIAAPYLDDNGDGSFYEIDGRMDYRTGSEERRALHAPRSITEASLARLARLLLNRR